MTHALRMGRRVLTMGVVGATIVWSIGLATLVSPLSGEAAAAGDLIKGSLPAVYYNGGDGKRYVFPNEKTFKTWYADFSSVKSLSDAEIAAIPIGGNVVYRGGTRLVKIQSDPKVYAVEPSGKLRWVESEAVASALYGSGWATRVDDVPDVFFSDYTPSASLSSAAAYPAGSLLKNTGSADTYLINAGGKKQKLDAAGMSANRYWDKYVIETSQNLSVYADGSAITGADATLSDASQKGGTGTGATPTAGGLMVSLASDTPASTTIPRGAAGVPMLAFELSASGGAATVSSLVLKRYGAGAPGDITAVYLYEDGSRLTDGRSITAATNEVTFSGLNLSLADGGKKKLWAKADIATTAGAAVHGFQVAAATKVGAGGSTVNGSFPVSGNQMSVAQATAGTITISRSGTIANPTVGQKDVEIGRFTLAVGTEAATLKNLTLTLEGSIRTSDISNFTLWQSSTKLATTASITGRNLVVFNLDSGYSMPDGTTRVFSVRADLTGDANRTVGLRLSESADLLATGTNFGFGLTVTAGGYNGGTALAAASGTCAATTDDCSFSTLQGATLTLAFNGPTASNIAVNSQDKVLMNFSMTAQQQVTVRDLQVTITCVTGADCDNDTNDNGGLLRLATEQNVKDVKVVKEDGTLLMGPQELVLTGADDAQTLSYTEDFTLTAGQTLNLKVTADIDNDASGNNSYRATIVMTSLQTAVDSNNTTLAANQIVPSANIAGNEMTVRAASLAVTSSQPPSDGLAQAHVRGSNNQSSVGYSFAAGLGADVTMTAVTYTVSVDGDIATDQNDFIVATETEADGGVSVAARDVVFSASLYDSDTGALLSGPKSVQAGAAGAVVFDNFVWTIPKGTTKKLLVRTNIANYTVTNEADAYAFRIADPSTDVTARDADGNNITPTPTAANCTAATCNGTAAAPTVYIRVTNSGTLVSALAANSPKSDLLLMGAADVPVSRFTFTSADEAFKVTELTVGERGAINHGGTAGDYDNNITSLKLQYPKQDGSTGTALAFLSGGEGEFSGIEFYVPANNSATVSVLATLAAFQGATSGEKPQFDFVIDTTNDDQFRADGLSSGATLDDDDPTGTTVLATAGPAGSTNSLAAFRHVVRRTQPTLALAAGSPTTGVPGLSEVLRFTVAASAGQAVVLDMITFKMTSTDNNGDSGDAGIADEWNVCDSTADNEPQQQLSTASFSLFDAAAPTLALESADTDWSLLSNTGAACADDAARVSFARLNLTTEEIIAAGTTKTYQLKVDTTGAAAANDDSIRFEIVNEPIVSTFIDSTRTFNGAATVAATTLTLSSSTGIVVGDLVCNGGADTTCAAAEEIMLVTGVPSGTTITVSRGDIGRAAAAVSIGQSVLRMPATLYWDDDGLAAVTAATAASGYLVDGLDVLGATIVY